MTRTPWGDSETLRERQLPPGPGAKPEEVARSQRERLFGAMVAACAERGYEASTIVDLSEISGVSSRSFYDLFGDKQACFLATLEAIMDAAIGFAAASAGQTLGQGAAGGVRLGEGSTEEASWEAEARLGFDAFANMVAAQPAAARLGLIEAYAAGPEALAPLEAAVAEFEWLTRKTLQGSPQRAEMPAEMVSAHIGAMREIASTRLRQGREAELPGLMDELWELMRSYQPPPAPLRVTGRAPPSPLEESLEAHDHAERALRGLAVVVAEKGYAAATVDDVVRRAAMSATTFYANFGGKEDAMMGAIESAGAQIVAACLPAFRRAGEWAPGVRAGFGALFSFLASRPALARLVMVEVYAAGPEAVERRAEALAPLRALMAEGHERRPQAPAIATEAIAAGVYTLAYRKIRDKGPRALPELAPICSYIALAPFVGAEEACRVANGDGRARDRGGVSRIPIGGRPR